MSSTLDRNTLADATSPYLLQHADNPVHWQMWSDATLAAARAANRLILLSIGYAACHWCHVMAHESFEDPATAALMNRLYVNIKVDREERPDIDGIYMTAVQAMGEQGGWPLTVIMTPDGAPIFGGTYFPPEPRWGRPSFRQVLEMVADAWKKDGEKFARSGASLLRRIAAHAELKPGAPIAPGDLAAVTERFLGMMDWEEGGLRGAPKFPNAPIFRFLWGEYARTGRHEAGAVVALMLARMAQGGICDHLGGGFARYATDESWLVPHFEKMLYDNAQLLDLLALAHAAEPDLLLAARAAELVEWLRRDMRARHDPAPDGTLAFAASEDADSEGEEGKFYVWTRDEIASVLGAEMALFEDHYPCPAAGNWEGKLILTRATHPEHPETEARLAALRARLFAAREGRVRPGWDDKILADWNGLAIAALCRAAQVFAQPAWQDAAVAAYAFLRSELAAGDGRINHAWRLGRCTAAGLLDDHASLARAALALFEATGSAGYLADAVDLAEAAERWFADPDSAYFTTAADAADLPLGPAARPRSAGDTATPSGNGLLAEVLARLHHLTGAPLWRQRAERVLRAFGGLGSRLSACPTLLAAADLLEEGAAVVIAGPATAPQTGALIAAALTAADPAVCVLRAASAEALPALHPAHGKIAPAASAAAYVCRGGVCGLPVQDPTALAALLIRRQRPAPA